MISRKHLIGSSLLAASASTNRAIFIGVAERTASTAIVRFHEIL